MRLIVFKKRVILFVFGTVTTKLEKSARFSLLLVTQLEVGATPTHLDLWIFGCIVPGDSRATFTS